MKKTLIPALVVAALVLGAWYAWQRVSAGTDDDAVIGSNGRIEATDVNVATKTAGRVSRILVEEGAFVKADQVLATMQVLTLEAQAREAQAQHQEKINSVASAQAEVAMRQSDRAAQVAQVRKAEAEVNAARRRLARSETLAKEGAISGQTLDDDRAALESTEAAVAAAKAQVASAEAAIAAAQARVVSARSQVEAARATIERIQSDIDDSQLKAPRDGRVQFLLAQPGEVLSAGGQVLNLIDLSDVYMTFYLPTRTAGRLALGSEVRIVLDAAPHFVIPARISYVASAAQFTPKTVETASEREKLMFRVRARIDPELLRAHLEHVKTGLPGKAWVRPDPTQPWPAWLALRTGS
ncbi:MAG TPA: HlyD family efflux transporter periplasmic adaptor subunit [Rubrivivax sp.]|nr:HlyD family efflux transporter periplasmic adaptor subunit [Rubrivivax sp.]